MKSLKLQILQALSHHVQTGSPKAIFMTIDKSDTKLSELVDAAEDMTQTVLVLYGKDKIMLAERERFRKEAFANA